MPKWVPTGLQSDASVSQVHTKKRIFYIFIKRHGLQQNLIITYVLATSGHPPSLPDGRFQRQSHPEAIQKRRNGLPHGGYTKDHESSGEGWQDRTVATIAIAR